MATGLPKAALQRLTPHRNDPASAWLDRAGRLRVAALGWGAWAAFVVGLAALWLAMTGPPSNPVVPSIPGWPASLDNELHRLVIWPWRVGAVVTSTVGLAVGGWLRRAVLRMRNAQTLALVRGAAPLQALAVDDWSALDAQPDGRVVSLVGWVRGRAHLPQVVNGERCVGLAVPCRQTYHAVLEMMNDFDLVDEAGRAVPVQIADARLFGPANVLLDQAAVDSLDLPVGTLPSRHAVAFRDGDPVMVIGYKKTIVDPGQRGLRQAPVCAALASSAPRPLLLIPLDAERRQV